MNVSGVKTLKSLEDENARLQKLLADSMLDSAPLKDLLDKSMTCPARAKIDFVLTMAVR